MQLHTDSTNRSSTKANVTRELGMGPLEDNLQATKTRVWSGTANGRYSFAMLRFVLGAAQIRCPAC